MIIRKIRRTLERKGIGGLLRKAGRAIRRYLWQKRIHAVARRPLDLPMIKYRKWLDVPLVPISPGNIHLIDYIPDSRKQRLWNDYFKKGDLGFAAMHDGKAIAHVFATFRSFHDKEINFTIPVEPHQAYQFEGVVNLEFRGKGVFVTIMEPFWKALREHGKTETVAMFELSNRASCKFHKRLGFEPFLLLKSTILLNRFPFTSVRPWNPATDDFSTTPIKDGNHDTL